MSAKGISLFASAVLILIQTASSHAQTVYFGNDVLIPYVADGDVLVRDSQGAPLTGTNFVAQLYYGASASSLVADTAAPARFRPAGTSQPGTWRGENRALSGLSAGSLAVLAVRVWDFSRAPSYEQALALGAPAHDCGPFYYEVRLSGAVTNFYMFEFRARNGLAACPSNVLPMFQSQPQSQTVYRGETLTLSATVPNACLYQWRVDGEIAGFRPTLTISNAQPSHSGSYQLLAGNYSGSVTSQNAFVNVAEPPPPALVTFANNVLSPPPARLVHWVDGSPLTGTNYVAQLYYGLNDSNLSPVTNPPARFRDHTTTSAGTWNGGTRVLPGITPGTRIRLQVKIWDLRHGATFEEASSQGRFALAFFPFSYTPPVDPLTPFDLHMENFQSAIWLSCPLFPTPIIHVHPTNQTVRSGDSVTLRAVAEYPCQNQWYFNGTPLQNARSSSLTIPNVQPANVGDYYVRVSNMNGAVTSQVARVSLIGQPRLGSLAFSAAGFTFEVAANHGETFVIEATTNLNAPVTWTPIATNIAPFRFSDSTTTEPQRFYRTLFR